jgi:very-short-patch-repair endonuclease
MTRYSLAEMKERKKQFARFLRKDQTKAEEIAWSHLKDRRFNCLKFRRQHVIEGFVADFLCKEIKLILELDGSSHDGRKEYDRKRQAILESKGYCVIRLRNSEISRFRNVFHNKLEGKMRIAALK